MSEAASVPTRLLGLLGAAAREHRRVTFGYLADDESHSDRRVDPYRQVLHRRHWYLLGWDTGRDDWRTFRLDRMTEVETTRDRFTAREIPGGSAAVYVENSRTAPRHRAVLTFEAPLATVADRLMGQEGEFEDLGADRCRAALWVDSYEWLAAITLSMGIDFGIEEPEGFRTHCATLRDRLDRAVRQAE
ncbi:MAG: helix-turn-helix transcriptional regulator [Nocardioidaceae bacterium]